MLKALLWLPFHIYIYIYILYLLTFVDMLGDIIYIYIYIRIGHVHIDEGSNARHWHAR